MRRAMWIALVVGPVLVAVNHGPALLRGDAGGVRLLQIVLTLGVPVLVAAGTSVVARHGDTARAEQADDRT